MKTVKCPKCEAEQGIYNRDGDTMKCVFCGADIELPEYEEGEDSFKGDVDFPKTEPQGESISCEYILKYEEVETALFAAGKIRKRNIIVWVETIILALLALAMAASLIPFTQEMMGLGEGGKSNWFILIMCVILIPIVWILPERNKKKMIQSATTGNKIIINFYENLAEIAAEGAEPWILEFRESYRIIEQNNVTIIVLSNGQILPIPDRAFPEENLQKVKALIAADKNVEKPEQNQN